MSSIARIVLAGGNAPAGSSARLNGSARAMTDFHGRRLLDIVVDAMMLADPIAAISVVGDVPDSPSYSTISDHGDFVSNLYAGLEGYRDADWVLISSADLPFVTGDIIAEFVRAALTLAVTAESELIYPIVPVSECYARYPGIKRTAIRLREGEYTGGNMMLARPAFLLRRRTILARTYAARKNPLRLAAMLGAGTVGLLALSQLVAAHVLSVSLLEKRVGRLMGGRVAALICGYPEIATDLDRPSDFVAASAYAGANQPPAP